MHDTIDSDGGDGRSSSIPSSGRVQKCVANRAEILNFGPKAPDDGIHRWLDAQASGTIANDRAPPEGEDDQRFADRLYQLCLFALQDFHRQELRQPSAKSQSSNLRECLGRFYLWGEPFGVGELDKALRQSDELRDNVLERLGHVGKIVLRKSAPSKKSSKALHLPSKQIIELESLILQAKHIVSRDENEIPRNGFESDDEYDSNGDSSSDSGSYNTIEDIDFVTRDLMELGPSLEQNLVHAETARNQRSHLNSESFSVSGPATFYVQLVRQKFERAHYKLVERLGEANWQRHNEVRKKMEESELSPEEIAKFAGETSVARSLFRPYSDFHDSGLGTSVAEQIEYAPSHSSFQSSNVEGERMSLRVPKEPAEVSAGKPFQCFLCRCILSSVKNRADWKMHVFADLRPYICTFPDCKDELAQFTTRAAWADHEFTEHRHDRIWNCPECSEEIANESDWGQHLREMHRRVFSGPQLRIAMNTAHQVKPRPVGSEECPLCLVVPGKTRRAFVKHIARHMEEIALMALPHSTEDDSDESSTSNHQLSRESDEADPLAARTGSEAREELNQDHRYKGATSDATNEEAFLSQQLEAARRFPTEKTISNLSGSGETREETLLDLDAIPMSSLKQPPHALMASLLERNEEREPVRGQIQGGQDCNKSDWARQEVQNPNQQFQIPRYDENLSLNTEEVNALKMQTEDKVQQDESEDFNTAKSTWSHFEKSDNDRKPALANGVEPPKPATLPSSIDINSSNTAPVVRSNDRATEEDWAKHRSCIENLYVHEGKTLKLVIHHMKCNFGFRATVGQYKSHLAIWGLQKNIKESEMRAIVIKNKQRADQGKRSVVHIGDIIVGFGEVDRYWKRKGVSIDDIVETASPMPETVQVFTPEPSPIMKPQVLANPETSSIVSGGISKDLPSLGLGSVQSQP